MQNVHELRKEGDITIRRYIRRHSRAQWRDATVPSSAPATRAERTSALIVRPICFSTNSTNCFLPCSSHFLFCRSQVGTPVCQHTRARHNKSRDGGTTRTMRPKRTCDRFFSHSK